MTSTFPLEKLRQSSKDREIRSSVPKSVLLDVNNWMISTRREDKRSCNRQQVPKLVPEPATVLNTLALATFVLWIIDDYALVATFSLSYLLRYTYGVVDLSTECFSAHFFFSDCLFFRQRKKFIRQKLLLQLNKQTNNYDGSLPRCCLCQR